MWGDGCESPGHEPEAVDRERRARSAQGIIPSNDAQDDFGCYLGGNGRRELLQSCAAAGRKMSGNLNLASLRSGRQELFKLFRDFRRGGYEAATWFIGGRSGSRR